MKSNIPAVSSSSTTTTIATTTTIRKRNATMRTTSIYDEAACVLERINAMRMREENTPRCHEYFTAAVDSKCRKLMVDWCFTVVDAFALNREAVWVALSLLDRYLSSSNGRSIDALKCTHSFQRCAITALYMAIKIHEPSVLGIKLLVKLCRGAYTEGDIIATEGEILFALDWRVCASLTAPMEYVRHFVWLLPEIAHVAEDILANAAMRMDVVTSDAYFSTCRSSSVGVACLAGALDDVSATSLLDVEALWRKLSCLLLDWDVASGEIRRVEKRLNASGSSSCLESRMPSRASLPRNSLESTGGQPSSPGSVVQ